MTTSNRVPVLTPQGHLVLAPTDDARTLPGSLQERLDAAFERGAGEHHRNAAGRNTHRTGECCTADAGRRISECRRARGVVGRNLDSSKLADVFGIDFGGADPKPSLESTAKKGKSAAPRRAKSANRVGKRSARAKPGKAR